MSSADEDVRCDRVELIALYVLEALPSEEAAALKIHIGECGACQRELAGLRPIIDGFVGWPADVLRPSASMHERLAERIAKETGSDPVSPPASDYREPEWEEVATGIFTKILATDIERDRVTMLVRLLPGVSYPSHTHAGTEELHLLDGELWIEDRLLHPGDYNCARYGTSDQRVYSETGCTCVLITSPSDVLRSA